MPAGKNIKISNKPAGEYNRSTDLTERPIEVPRQIFIKQPNYCDVKMKKKRVSKAKYLAGFPRAQHALIQMGFDPIKEHVERYRELQQEILYQEALRIGLVIEKKQDGKPRAYRAELHHSLLDKVIKIGESLLRYGYGRVPEKMELDVKPVSKFVINTTKKGEVFVGTTIEEDKNEVIPSI